MRPTHGTIARPASHPLSLALVFGLCLGWGAGCSKPATTREAQPAVSEVSGQMQSAPQSEAEKTRELQEKAAGYEDRYKEIQESDMTAEQKAQEVGELVDEQQRTVREAEDGPSGAESEEPQ